MKDVLNTIADQHGWKIENSNALHGGDINKAFCLDTNQGKFFIKLNDAKRLPKMLEKEAIGLTVLQKHFALKVPEIIAFGIADEQQYLVLEWLQAAVATAHSWQAFGQALAELHKVNHTHFGWQTETYVASHLQTNDWNRSWPQFYFENRIMPLVKILQDSCIFSNKEVQQAEIFCNRFATMMPDEPPALLHGDLWSGNVMSVFVNNQTTMAIYDPSVFYGHREIDMAMTRLFGGFPPEFYTAYQEAYPLQSEWQQRLPVFQLYPLLVHAVLFGGGYVGRVKKIINN